MIIGIMCAIGLAALTLSIIAARYDIRLAFLLIIPITYGSYYAATTQLPKYFGYPITINFTSLPQSVLITAVPNGETIVLMIREKDAKDPRLVSIPNNDSNRKILADIAKQAKNGGSVIRGTAKKGNSNQKGNGHLTESDIEAVPLKEQDILKKDD